MNRRFFLYVLPAILSFTLSGVYAIVDGFFVGRSIGDAGLAAIGLAYPLTALIQAVGSGLGMGGAIWISISRGKNDREKEAQYFSQTILLLAVGCLAVTGLLWVGTGRLLLLFGARGELFSLANEYLRVIVLGATLQIFGTGLVPILRNLGGTVAAMTAMMSGFVANILLDYLFVSVWQHGMWGAAVATVIGQGITVTLCIFHLRRRGTPFRRAALLRGGTVKNIFLTGLSPFGLSFSPNLAIILVNRSAVTHGGEQAVACYAVISYILVIVQMMMQGIGDGTQPLISQCYGEGDEARAREYRGAAYRLAALLALLGAGAIFSLRRPLAAAFGVSAQVLEQVAAVLPIFLCGLVFAGFLRVTTSYFYATHGNARAYLLIYGEPMLLTLLLVILPNWAGLLGVWISTPLCQLALATVGLFLLKRSCRAGVTAAVSSKIPPYFR